MDGRGDTRGSTWGKWDLHVHTPASLIHHYGGVSDGIWEQYISDLENLPPEFRVLGINDYLFIDGYRRLLEAKRGGRLQNIELLLPVIELRIDKFGGSEGKLRRANLHVLFSERVSPDVIQHQFLNALFSRYQIAPAYADLPSRWNALPTHESLTELGRMIIASVPEAERRRFEAPLKEGFNNLNFQFDAVLGLLQNHHFAGQALTAIGKTEWESIKWGDHSIADKKHIINSVDMVFTAAATPDDCLRARKSLRASNVNPRLFDCSDAHRFSSSQEKDRIGNSFTWIKADATFAGLRHTLTEFDDRVFVGERPPKLDHVDRNPTRYIDRVQVKKTPASTLGERWFDADIRFNPGLVAIIGNKGSGKSALADIIGLLGNTRNAAAFSFLNEHRFRQSRGDRSSHFMARLTWCSGGSETRQLDYQPVGTEVEFVKYIPQQHFENVCNEVATGQDGEFHRELRKVIFSHIPAADRLGQTSLEGLLDYQTEVTRQRIGELTRVVGEANRAIIELEDRLAPSHREALENKLAARRRDLEAHAAARPISVPAPDASGPVNAPLTREIEVTRTRLRELDGALAGYRARHEALTLLASRVEKSGQRLTHLRHQYELFLNECREDLEALGIEPGAVVTFVVNRQPLDLRRAEIENDLQRVQRELNESTEGSAAAERARLASQLPKLRAQLDEPNRRFQEFRKTQAEWEQQQRDIIGDTAKPGSITYYEAQLSELNELPATLAAARGRRQDLTSEIHDQVAGLAELYRQAFRGVQEFINQHELGTDLFQLVFDVAISVEDLQERFFQFISHGVTGSFCGVDEGEARLHELVRKHDFNRKEDVLAFLSEVLDCLENDRRAEGLAASVASQLRKGKSRQELYDYLFSLAYLQPRYVLKLNDRELDQLSPGEKGALLLAFYLLVDNDNVPLIIDQPEENLDNQTVVKLLVPSIKHAKQRRQVIIVTHSPNLAVVCDAEQIIWAKMDKLGGNRIDYVAGSLENPPINACVMDVLEGTRPAFDNRGSKYQTSGSQSSI